MSGKKQAVMYLIVVAIPVMVIAVKVLLIDLFRIDGHSMSPTLTSGEYVVVNKTAYGVRLPRNIYEIPWIGNVAALLSTDAYIDSVLTEDKPYGYIASTLPQRGDLLALNIPGNRGHRAVKRCVGIAGDTIGKLRGDTGSFHSRLFTVVPYKGMRINTLTLDDRQRRYLDARCDFEFDETDSVYIATDNFVYVLGDNRDASIDSRMWGPLPFNAIIGKIMR